MREARSWVVSELATLGREDLIDAAELGVSELVTNAILHATPPIVVRLGGTRDHPRIEVHDSSVAPPSVRDMTDEARLMTTVGRGLGILAMYSTSWGSEASAEGKVVWFEPAAEHNVPGLDIGRLTGEVFDVADLLDEIAEPAGDLQHRVVVCLLGMPVKVFSHYRVWHEELARELRLLSLNQGVDYPLAAELSELTERVEQDWGQGRVVDQLDRAVAADSDAVDIEYLVPASAAAATTSRLRELLGEVDVFCREQRLLTLAPGPQQLAVRSWYLGEIERQARGEAATPWRGSYAVEDLGR